MTTTKPETKAMVKTSFDITNTKETARLATILKEYITKQKLSCIIAGKPYVLAEGWQFAGAQLGIVPIAKKPNNIGKENEIKYECEVELLNIRTQQIVGYGYALCSNRERNKTSFDEYAIVSMAQTRAIGKAYRNLLAWIIKAAGFEATPYDEMESVKIEVEQEAKESRTKRLDKVFKPEDKEPFDPLKGAEPILKGEPPAPKGEPEKQSKHSAPLSETVRNAVYKCKTEKELGGLWKFYVTLHNNQNFIDLVKDKKAHIKGDL